MTVGLNVMNPYQLPDWFIQLHVWVSENIPGLSFIDIMDPWQQALMLFVWGVVLFVLISFGVAKPSVVFMVLMERKVLAWVTQRKGPNRVGPWGLLQTIADGVKLLFKEDVMTPGQDKLLFTLGPVIFFLPVFVLFALVPFTGAIAQDGEIVFGGLLGIGLPVGALLLFALSSISVIGMVLAGWASNNKYSLIGGMRSAAQAISYEIPLVLAVLAVVLYAGSMNLMDIVEAQRGPLGMFSWFGIFLMPLSFLIFLISSIAEVNRIPFDLPEAESELVSGYNTEYSGMKFAMFFLAEYAALFVMCALTVVFFFGGFMSPLAGATLGGIHWTSTLVGTPGLIAGLSLASALENMLGVASGSVAPWIIQLEMVSWMVLKIYFFIFFAMWIRGTLPRLKPDQLMGFSWKFLIPLSLLNIFMVSFWRMWLPPVKDLESMVANFTQNMPFGIVWALVLVVGIGGFCWFMSELQTRKLKARFTQS